MIFEKDHRLNNKIGNWKKVVNLVANT